MVRRIRKYGVFFLPVMICLSLDIDDHGHDFQKQEEEEEDVVVVVVVVAEDVLLDLHEVDLLDL